MSAALVARSSSWKRPGPAISSASPGSAPHGSDASYERVVVAAAAELVAFLCSPRGGWINGQILTSDGGARAPAIRRGRDAL